MIQLLQDITESSIPPLPPASKGHLLATNSSSAPSTSYPPQPPPSHASYPPQPPPSTQSYPPQPPPSTSYPPPSHQRFANYRHSASYSHPPSSYNSLPGPSSDHRPPIMNLSDPIGSTCNLDNAIEEMISELLGGTYNR